MKDVDIVIELIGGAEGAAKRLVFSALKNLGYSEKEILSVLRETGSSDLPFEGRLKKALSLLAPLR